MSTATLAGRRATRVVVDLPAWGRPWAKVTLDEETDLAGRVELVVADLRLSMTVVSGGPYKGSSTYHLVGGPNGWAKRIPAKGYKNDVGVKRSTVLAEAATAVGEELVPGYEDTTLGFFFERLEGQAGRVLQQVAPRAWFVDAQGRTNIGSRPATTGPTALDILSRDRARGSMTVASESIVKLQPGVTVDGLVALDVRHELGGEGGLRSNLRGSLTAATAADRAIEAYRRIHEQAFPEHRYRGVFEFRVVDVTSSRLDLQPARVSSGLSDLQLVPIRPGVAGAFADPALGSLCLVAFVDADPARPVVIAFDDIDGEAPTAAYLRGDEVMSAAAAAGRFVRWGDTMTGLQSGVDGPITFAAPQAVSTVKGGDP